MLRLRQVRGVHAVERGVPLDACVGPLQDIPLDAQHTGDFGDERNVLGVVDAIEFIFEFLRDIELDEPQIFGGFLQVLTFRRPPGGGMVRAGQVLP